MANLDNKPLILLADDDRELCHLLAEYLQQEGFDICQAHDGEAALRVSSEQAVDAMVLDIMMPRMNGIEVLRELRRGSELPVLMLTAKGEDLDRILGLELGADDYLPKPCNPRELVARLRAILRRSRQGSVERDIEVDDLVLKVASRQLFCDGRLIDLTSTEFSVIQALLQAAGSVVRKTDLYQIALGRQPERFDRSIDMHLSNLRKKLGLAKNGEQRIETVRGIGYQYRICEFDTGPGGSREAGL